MELGRRLRSWVEVNHVASGARIVSLEFVLVQVLTFFQVKSLCHTKKGVTPKSRLHAKKLRKQREADIRQAKYDSLSHADKIALVTNRGGSKRELARLTNPKAKSQTVVTTVTPSTPVVVTEFKKKRTPKSKVVAEAKTKRPAKS